MKFGKMIVGLLAMFPFGAGAHELVCGDGPHVLEIVEYVTCECTYVKPQLRRNGTWKPATKDCPAPDEKECKEVTSEEWSDWPFCEGSQPTSGTALSITGDGSIFYMDTSTSTAVWDTTLNSGITIQSK